MKSVAEILKDIRPDADYASSRDFVADGLLDSLDVIKLVSELSTRYRIEILGGDIVSSNFVDFAAIERLIDTARRRAGRS